MADEQPDLLTRISLNLQKGRVGPVRELVTEAISSGRSARDILEHGLLDGMDVIGAKFKNGDIYLPEVMIAARAMAAGTELLRPLLTGEHVRAAGRVCIGTVQGDKHDIGKNLVRMMMEGKGLEVIDLGVNVAPETFIRTAIDRKCQIIACSALLTTTMPVMRRVVEACRQAGIRDKVRIMVGGAPLTQAYCDEIGADAYTPDAARAAERALELCRESPVSL